MRGPMRRWEGARMGRLATGWQLMKTSLGVLRKDKELLVFPLISGIATLLVRRALKGGISFTVGFDAIAVGNGFFRILGQPCSPP